MYCSLLNIMPEELNKKEKLLNTSYFNLLSKTFRDYNPLKND